MAAKLTPPTLRAYGGYWAMVEPGNRLRPTYRTYMCSPLWLALNCFRG